MENQQSSKRFIFQSFDKFKNRTDTKWKDPQLGKVFGAKWDLYVWEISVGYGEDRSTSKLILGLRHVKTPEIDSIVIDYDYKANDWMFLRNGTMIVNLDGVNNVELKPHESDTDVRDGGRCNEVGFYNISKEDLKKICDANSIAVRVSGGSSYLEVKDKGLLKFQFMCRSFYSDLYDDHSYDTWINSIIPPGSEAKSGGGCFIATAAMGDYDHPVVMDLRMFRDNWLLKREWGVKFTNWYYTHGPKAANVIDKSTLLKKITFVTIVKPLQVITKKLR
jgi:hypothetical protein